MLTELKILPTSEYFFMFPGFYLYSLPVNNYKSVFYLPHFLNFRFWLAATLLSLMRDLYEIWRIIGADVLHKLAGSTYLNTGDSSNILNCVYESSALWSPVYKNLPLSRPIFRYALITLL